eukprot:232670-Rhodomonas_salina.1
MVVKVPSSDHNDDDGASELSLSSVTLQRLCEARHGLTAGPKARNGSACTAMWWRVLWASTVVCAEILAGDM